MAQTWEKLADERVFRSQQFIELRVDCKRVASFGTLYEKGHYQSRDCGDALPAKRISVENKPKHHINTDNKEGERWDVKTPTVVSQRRTI
jgi:hypothetical protein